jgi:DNA-binding MarR family transcriptional regulator
MDGKEVEEQVRLQDLDTGKLHVVAVRRYKKNSAGFVMMWQSEIDRLLSGEAAQLRANQWRVLMRLICDVEFENRVSFYVTDLADSPSRHRIEVSRALKVLEAHDFIRVIEKRPGRARTYLLNPELTFRGKPDQREATRKHWNSLRGATV